MKVIGYYVSIISVSITDVNNLDKKIFVNSIIYLFILSLIDFNLFLLKTCKNIQYTLARYYLQHRNIPGVKIVFCLRKYLFFIDLENFTFYFPTFLRKLALSGLFENYKTNILSVKS